MVYTNIIVQLLSIFVIHDCVVVTLGVLDNLVSQYLQVLQLLITKILVYPIIYYLNIALGLSFIFVYYTLKLIINTGLITMYFLKEDIIYCRYTFCFFEFCIYNLDL